MEGQNTISGLLAKREDFVRELESLESETRRVIAALDNLDATIRIFDPNAGVGRVKNYPVPFLARRGEMTKFVLGSLRHAEKPMTSVEIALSMIASRGLKADDSTITLIRKRVGACIKTLADRGVVQEVALVGNFKGWTIVSECSSVNVCART